MLQKLTAWQAWLFIINW